MADVEAQSTLTVEVQGEESLNRLAAAFQNLAQQAQQVQRTVQVATTRATPAAATRTVQTWLQQQEQEFTSLRSRIALRMAYGAALTARNVFDGLKASATVVGRSLLSLTGSMGSLAASAGIGATAVIGVGLAMTGLAIPIVNLIAGFKLMRSTFGWAQDAAEEQIRVAARTRRFYPQLLGEGLEAAESEMHTRMGLATALFGDAAESMQEQITRRFTQFRMGRGLRGERDIFSRWGITPENVQRFESIAGTRIDLAGWLERFTLKREELESRLARAQTPQERAMLTYKLGVIVDDTTKLFGQRFSDMMSAMTSADLGRLSNNLRAAIPLGHVENATRRGVEFKIALESLKGTFAAIVRGIGGDVQPAITGFLAELNRRMLETDKTGKSLGMAFRELASSLANKAWETLRDIMAQIDVEKVNSWIAAVEDWQPQETAETIKGLIKAVWDFGTSVASVVRSVQEFWASLPDWLKNVVRGMLHGPGGAPRAAPAREGLAPAGPQVGGEPSGAAPEAPSFAPGQLPTYGGGLPTGQAPALAPFAGAPAAPAPAAPEPRTGIFRRRGAGMAEPSGPTAPAAGPPPPTPTTPAGAPTTPAGAAPSAPPGLAAPTAPAPGPPPTARAGPAAAGAPPTPPAGPPAAGAPSVSGGGAPAGMIPPEATAAQKRPWYDPRRWLGVTRAAAAEAPGGVPGSGAAAGSPPPPPVTAAEGPPPTPTQPTMRAAGEREPTPTTTTGPSPTTMDALKGAAAGSAFSAMTDIQSTPSGDAIVMKAGFVPGAAATRGAGRAALWGLGTAAGAATGLPVGSALQGALQGATEAEAGRGVTAGGLLRGAVPGMGVLDMMKKDAEQGHPVRSYLRSMMGIEDPGEPAPWQRRDTEALSAPYGDRYQAGWSGGITPEDGTNFGTAAAESMREGIRGLSIGGTPSTSYGVAPRTAPKPTGGDTPTEA